MCRLSLLVATLTNLILYPKFGAGKNFMYFSKKEQKKLGLMLILSISNFHRENCIVASYLAALRPELGGGTDLARIIISSSVESYPLE